MTASLELHDIQGLFARAYPELRAARFLLLAIDEGTAARRWVGALADGVTPGDRRPGDRAVNVAFTSRGLERLGLAPEVLNRFSNEFVAGMTTEHRRRILGDLGDDAPERWDWAGPTRDPVDGVLLLYASDDAALARLEDVHTRALATGGIRVVHRLQTSDQDGFEPFGFRDGISQPIIEGLSKTGPPQFTVRAGEFVLGYPNEHGRYTDRPTLEATGDAAALLPRDPSGSGRADLGRNGSYLVVRQLRQDVRAFWRFLDAATRRADGTADPTARTRLGAKMVGRWPGGAPLALAPETDAATLADANDFGYFHEDRRGARCPIGSHIRRANPRDSLDPKPGTDKSYAINKRHRLLRRGREYGPPLKVEEALSGDGAEGERGIHFICLSANIARQFEFVQHTWVNNPKFADLYDDADPLVAPSQPFGGTFVVQSDGLRWRVKDVPRFVSVRGGAYFFLPGIRALRYLARLGA